jgi:hypothetical protein
MGGCKKGCTKQKKKKKLGAAAANLWKEIKAFES